MNFFIPFRGYKTNNSIYFNEWSFKVVVLSVAQSVGALAVGYVLREWTQIADGSEHAGVALINSLFLMWAVTQQAHIKSQQDSGAETKMLSKLKRSRLCWSWKI